MERRLLTGALLIFAVSVFFITINIYYQKTIEQPVYGGSYTEGIVGQPSFVNPLIGGNNSTDNDLIEILYSNLDDLAENYQISENNKSWRITLKENLNWSDGEPITADDVLFTIETIQDPSNNHPLYPTWHGIVVERLNENEIRLTLKSPYVFLIDNFRELKIAPAHIFGTIPAANLRLSQYNLEPVSSGPYQFVSFETRKDGFITDYRLIVNDNYHNDTPYIEKINFKFYSNEADLIKAFNRREIDALGGLNHQYLKEIEVGHQVITMNLPRYYAIFFNPNTSAPLKSKSVRRALSLATNKKKIIKEIFNDQTLIMHGPLPPNISGYDQDISKNDKFNLKDSAALLDKAGFTTNDEGVRIEFDIIVPQISFLVDTANLLKEDWAKVGVKLNLVILNPADINNDVIRTRNYEILIFGNILKKNPDLFSFWHSSERFFPGRNLALYNSRKVDDLLEAIRQDFNNHSRNQKLIELQQKINDDKPAIFLYSPNYLYITPKNLHGFRSYFVASPANRFERIEEWHLKTSREFQ